jgi:Domain of unknown function (DUF4382)
MRSRIVALIAALAVTGACGGSTPTEPSTASSSNSSTSPAPNSPAPGPTSTGQLTLMLKDSPYSDAKALLVTFSEVNVHASGGDWVTLPFASGTSRTCDLKKLETAQDVLGVGTLAAGHYTQIRLVVSSATLYFQNASSGAACALSITAPAGTKASVEVPSGELKLNREFDLTSGGTKILLDFDGDQSVKQAGNDHSPNGVKYMMTPVIAVVSVE